LSVMRVVKWELWWSLKIVMGLCRGWGRMCPWHTFMMVWRHTVESLLMAEVRWAVYWVTCVCRGVGCYNCMLESLEAIRFCVRSPYALFKFSFGDYCALGIDFTLVDGEGCDHGGPPGGRPCPRHSSGRGGWAFGMGCAYGLLGSWV
jgi:hypothetical protein